MKKINIPIHSHTPKKRPISKYVTGDKQRIWAMEWYGMYEGNMVKIPLITDLQRVPKADVVKNLVTGELDRLPHGTLAYWQRMHTLQTIPPFTVKGEYPTKKLGFWRNLWQNKIRRKR